MFVGESSKIFLERDDCVLGAHMGDVMRKILDDLEELTSCLRTIINFRKKHTIT